MPFKCYFIIDNFVFAADYGQVGIVKNAGVLVQVLAAIDKAHKS